MLKSPLRIVTYNVNGIRSAMTKGLIDWLKTDPADIVCIQETKAHKDSVNHALFSELGYHDYWFSAKKKGYSGVAVLTKIKPDHVEYGTGHEVSDDEGRVIQLVFGDLRLINAYFPSGSSGEEDSFRHLNPDPHHYTWWSQRFPTVREQNKGWRLDYISVTDTLKGSVVKACIYPDVRQSDHCPVYLELALK